jgi:outer membrane protein OmpA-like peptidoglycan-associated protein
MPASPEPAPTKPASAEPVALNAMAAAEPEPVPAATPGLPSLPNLLFANNTAWLSRSSRETLAQVVSRLKAHPESQVVLSGHTDDQGSPELNRALARERALRAAKWLELHGIAADRIVTRGFGSRHPLAEDSSPEGRAHNRRVEIELR